MIRTPIYFDNNATTPTDPRVVEAMLPYFTEHFGNAASQTHSFGWTAQQAVETARKAIAAAINASPREIVFTSGATESDNLAIKGVSEAYADRGSHIVTVQTEHKAILDSCKHLEKHGFQVTYLPPEPDGLLDLNRLADAITEKTILVSVMQANNEIGVVQDIAAIGALCRERGVLFHTDASQSLGKVPLDVEAMHIDLASFTAHKLYGPKGIGALYVRRRDPQVNLAIQMDGGGHERGFRSGTLNVTGIVGFGKAVEICMQEREQETARLVHLRDRLKRGLQSALPNVCVNGHETQRLPGNLNVSFHGVVSDSLMMGLSDVALSSGSACSSGSLAPSYVLKALGLREETALSAIRFGLGRFNTEEEVDYVIGRCVEVVRRLRALSPLVEE
ncbi:MAG TPA: IscS subfamily cysteine desulfurase [Chthonomonadaceae bacterium]|nr:IscS subfamily cysteine desulfurase [Chthonomonadaceae bacterium]